MYSLINALRPGCCFQLLFILFAQGVAAQHKDIFLVTCLDPQRRTQLDLTFKNKADTAFLSMKHMEDMGYRYGTYYEFRNKVRDGVYQVYVDGILKEKATIINGLKTTVERSKGVVFYRKMVSLHGHTGSAALLFQSLSKSDKASFKFSDMIEKRGIGFYADTLNGNLFYNNYLVGDDTIDTVHKTNFDHIYDVGELSLLRGYLAIRKQNFTNKNFDDFFFRKVNLENLNKNVLLRLSDFSAKVLEKANARTKSHSQSFLIDLDGDGTKEKLVMILRFDMDTPFEERAVRELEFDFHSKKQDKWMPYDSIKITGDELEKNIDQITIFGKERLWLPKIYINSSSTTKNGKMLQSQILLMGAFDRYEMKIKK